MLFLCLKLGFIGLKIKIKFLEMEQKVCHILAGSPPAILTPCRFLGCSIQAPSHHAASVYNAGLPC